MTLAHQLADIAIEIIRPAGELAAKRRQAGVSVAATKSALADIVTAADQEVEAFIRAELAKQRPGDGFLGEESGAVAAATEITWVVDPIDGTVNYAFGIPAWAVSIAAVVGKPHPETWEVLAGAVFNPISGELFHAAQGSGAWLQENQLAVSPGDSAAGALLGTGFSYQSAARERDVARLTRVMPLARDIRRIGAAALDLAFVAAGRLDGYYERGLHPWDHAAGELLVTEAGGRFARLPGDTADARPVFVAAGAALFDRLVAVAS